MRESNIETPARCATCAHFDKTPNPFTSENGDCTVMHDDGLPPILPLVGISRDRLACEYYTFKKN